MTPTTLSLIFLIGFFGGLRCLTPPAVTAWGARVGWFKLGAGFSWLGDTAVAIVFALLAAFEIVNDKLPKTPPRTAPAGLIARIVMGGFTGACLASTAGASIILGATVAIVGALAGTFGGYHARRGLVRVSGAPDYIVAVAEDLVAVVGSVLVVSRF
jgi:uncharacterized membrane protein